MTSFANLSASGSRGIDRNDMRQYADLIKDLLKEYAIRCRNVVFVIRQEDAYVRRFELPLMTEEQLRLAGIESVVFDRIEANPLKSTVMAGAAAAREHGCDMIVALGGGSVMDAAKAIALMASNDGDLWDYVFGGTGKEQQAGHAPLPLIA